MNPPNWPCIANPTCESARVANDGKSTESAGRSAPPNPSRSAELTPRDRLTFTRRSLVILVPNDPVAPKVSVVVSISVEDVLLSALKLASGPLTVEVEGTVLNLPNRVSLLLNAWSIRALKASTLDGFA